MEAREIAEKIFKLRGYAISKENNIIIALKENNRVAIACVGEEKDIGCFDELVNTKADKKIFICNVPLDSEAQEQVKSLNIILWNRDELEKELGKAIIASGEKEQRYIFLKSVVNKEEAEIKVKHLGLNSLTLEFLPYYLYKYAFQTFEKGYLDLSESSGIIGINGLNGNYKILKFELDSRLLDEPKTEIIKRVLAISENKAFELAKQALIELNTKVIEVRDKREGAIIFEKRRVAPSKESISLSIIGICYIPFWYAKGKFGSAIIDCITGEVVKEEITQAIDEKIEVV